MNGGKMLSAALCLALIQCFLIVLKFDGILGWHWVWILMPFWVPSLVIVISIAFVFWGDK